MLAAEEFTDGVPEEKFSVADCRDVSLFFKRIKNAVGGWLISLFLLDLLKHKAQPEAAVSGVEAWVKGKREMRERLQCEKDGCQRS